ncbi:hypothetical protein [Dolichospermum sp. UHCC 0259]|uniref:hypothetical protein n=1 Tax=Dolichospermum sp. UHCC 0259 TaxID=2590010 RepID=UPI0014475439|nr:hypothetical protein [Dolichospermum sp. UHCC 0259]MTJ50854.1 hypothetical protein [Dolichospermum sp. UHCC 0259]
MQVKIDLSDELGKQLLEMPDMQLLVQKAVEKMLLEEQQKHSSTPLTVKSSQLLVDLVNDLPEFPTFKNQDPLNLQRALRDEWD